MIDTKLQQQLHEKYNPEGSVLRHAQLRMTEMLVFLDKVCTKYHLRYWLDSGTLLGACRHGGFIPWDDDTDVCMPIEDLRKLRQIFATEHLSDEFILQTPDNDKNYLRIEWCVLRDLKSEYIQNSNFHRGLRYRGLQIDIFPLETEIRPCLKKITNKFQNAFIDKPVMSPKIAYSFGMIIARISRAIMTGVMVPIFHLFKDHKLKNCYTCAYGIPFMESHLLTTIYPLQRIKFEGYMLNVPSNLDTYLTDIYGNWRKLPEPDQIQTHHVEIKFYDHPVY